jgi:hypothetical protein
MAKEYLQTLQVRVTSTKHGEPLNPPDGPHWTLHSAHPVATGEPSVLLIWEREQQSKIT